MNINTQNKLLAYIKYHKKNSTEKQNIFKEFLKKILNMFLSINILYFKHKKTKTDVLFIHNNKNAITRLSTLLTKLKENNVTVQHEYFLFDKNILKKFSKPDYPVKYDLIVFAAYAKYLVTKYQPNVIVTFMNSSLISPFLREELNNKGIYVNISHSVTPNSSGDSMTDFDYYLLFGQSSLDNLLQNPIRIGDTKAILTGSPFINFFADIDNTKPDPNNILFFSTYSPDSDEGDVLDENTRIVMDWAKQNQNYTLFIKVHPLDDPKRVKKIIGDTPNIKILPQNIQFTEALKNISIVLNSWSNASIEAAVLGKPTVVINTSNLHDNYLKFERFFLPKASTPEEITQRIKETLSNYQYFVGKAQEFSHYHLDRLDSVDYIAKILITLNNGEKPENIIFIKEDISGLKSYL